MDDAQAGMVLKTVRKRAHVSQGALARRLDVSEDVISNLERGITPITRDMRRKLAAALECTEDELKVAQQVIPTAAKPGNVGPIITVARSGWIQVPIYGALAAGAPGYSMSDVIEIELMPEWPGDFERWGRVITGTSMEEEFLDGDIAIFENRRAEDGHGVHAFTDGEESFKILRFMPDGSKELWPINGLHEPFSAEDYDIRGVCIQRIRKGAHGIRDIREYPQGFRWRDFKK